MTLRLRIALAAAIAVAAAVGIASFATYLLVGSELRGHVDRSLQVRAAAIVQEARLEGGNPARFLPEPLGGRYGGPVGLAQIVTPAGAVLRAPDAEAALPVDSAAQSVAAGGPQRIETVRVDGIGLRVLMVPLPQGGALELARPIDELTDELHRIALWLALIAVCGVALAALLGLAVARGALAPLRRLANVVDHVTRTRDLDRRVEVHGKDELSLLGEGVNRMLDTVSESAATQRQLVADASHELRTPLTSARADIAYLRRAPSVDDADRDEILAGVDARLRDMSELVRELMELAEGDAGPVEREPVRFDRVTAAAVQRLRRDHPEATVETELAPVTVLGAQNLLERAVANLLDNAAKWNDPAQPIEVSVSADGTLAVRDHGPGIPAEALAHVFERFYRAESAGEVPGFGLGLAIVKRVVEAHGGSVEASNAPDGGARVRLRVPVADVALPDSPPVASRAV